MQGMLLKGYCASLFQGCTIISSGLNLLFGLVISAIGTVVAFSPYAKSVHCDTIGYMMMIAGLIVVAAGAMAMFSACYEKIWAAQTALFLTIIGLCLLIAAAGYASSVQGSIKSLTKTAYTNFTLEEKQSFEKEHACCGYDVIQEASPGCLDVTACGVTFVKIVEKYPNMATLISAIGAACLMFSLLMTLMMVNKMKAAVKKQERHDRRHVNDERPTRVHRTTKLGSRFGVAKAADEAADETAPNT